MAESTENEMPMKYILVTGGVISGIGKGVISSSIGTLLKGFNLQVTAIKIDPYINIDAGTFSPYEHGEVFVLDDGGEVDLDLGNYERFLEIRLHRENNITTGKIFQQVITKERRGDYLGKTVQYVPHITDEIQDWVERVAKIPVNNFDDEKDKIGKKPQFCVIELGGTIGDIESMAFVEAFRQFQYRVGHENFLNIHVSLILEPSSTGEQKTKPTQRSVRDTRLLGLNPDLILCRSERPLLPEVKKKIAYSCNIDPEQVISVHDMPSLYRVPKLLVEQGIIHVLEKKLHLHLPLTKDHSIYRWESLAEKAESHLEMVNIALVGKYTKLEDSYASVTKALRHASLHCNKKLNLMYIEGTDLEENTKAVDEERYEKAWSRLKSAQGLLVPGGFDSRGVEGKINAINYARTSNIPFLGICLGFQCAVIEFTRNVYNLKDANSTEFENQTPHKVIIDMPEHNTGSLGGTMRLGLRTTVFNDESSILKKLYGGKSEIEERHRHRYEVNPEFVSYLEQKGLKFVGKDTEKVRMEIFELPDHPFFVGVQFHPEFLSRPLKPSPPFVGLIAASCGVLKDIIESR